MTDRETLARATTPSQRVIAPVSIKLARCIFHLRHNALASVPHGDRGGGGPPAVAGFAGRCTGVGIATAISHVYRRPLVELFGSATRGAIVFADSAR